MATCPANRTGQHKIYDYYNRLKGIQTMPDLVSWKHQVQHLTPNKVIVGWNHYTTPLHSLGVMGEVGRWLTYITRGLNTNHGLFHKFLTFELKDVSTGEVCSVSIEKQRDGLLFQRAKSEETVRDKAEGSIRQGVVKRSRSSEEYGFEGLLVNNLANIMEVTEVSQANAFYSLLFANCQHTVADWQKALVEKSVSLMFKVPGSDQSISIDDDAMVSIIEMMYPEWKKGSPQQFPNVRNPFAIEVSTPLEENKIYSQLKWKELVYKTLCNFLKFPKREHEAIVKGRKAIMCSLTKCNLQRSLSQIDQLTTPVIDQMAELWSSTFDIVVTLESLGVIIFSFQDKDENSDIEHDLDAMVNLASKIENIPKEAGKSIHLVLVILDAKRDIQGNVEEQKYGYMLQVALTSSTIHDHIQLKAFLASCMHSLYMRVKPAKKRHIFCERFAAKLFLLQNMEDESVLIHKRIESQEFGPAGFCIWTEEQSKIIHEARKAFMEGQHVSWIIHGCYGSGKTLLLMQMARDFIKLNKGDVFIFVPPTRIYLKKQLEEILYSPCNEACHARDDAAVICSSEQNRIMVGTDLTRPPADISLMLHDEFDSTREPLFDAGNLSRIIFQSAWIDPRPMMYSEPGERNVCKFELEGNLRSTSHISSFIGEFQKHISTSSAHVLKITNQSTSHISSFIGEFQKHISTSSAHVLKITNQRRIRISPEEVKWYQGWKIREKMLAYPISTALKSRLGFCGEEPSISLCKDGSSNRDIFLDSSVNAIMALEAKHKKVMVSCFMHYKLKTKLIERLQEKVDGGNIIFPSPLEAHGCQFPAVLLIIDREKFRANPEEIVAVMSRATLSLRVIFNDVGECEVGKSYKAIIEFFSKEKESDESHVSDRSEESDVYPRSVLHAEIADIRLQQQQHTYSNARNTKPAAANPSRPPCHIL